MKNYNFYVGIAYGVTFAILIVQLVIACYRTQEVRERLQSKTVLK